MHHSVRGEGEGARCSVEFLILSFELVERDPH